MEDNEIIKKVAVMGNDIVHIKRDLDMILGKLDNLPAYLDSTYVTKAEFSPVKKAVYTAVGILVGTVITGLISLLMLK